MTKKTDEQRLLITCFHSLVSRNLFQGGLLGRLRIQGIRPVLCVPSHKEAFFREQYGDVAEVVPFDVRACLGSRRNRLLGRLAYLAQMSRYHWYKDVERLRQHKRSLRAWLVFLFTRAVRCTLSRMPGATRILVRSVSVAIADISIPRQVIRDHCITHVFATDLFGEEDACVLLAARALDLPVTAMVRSWDNCHSKGILRAVPNHVIVNTYILKEDLVALHAINPERITVVGVPQLDRSITDTPVTREEFCRVLGIDPDRKIIMFAPAGTILSDTDADICDILANAIDNGAFLLPVYVLVRNHPHHPADLSTLEHRPDFIIEAPGARFGRSLKDTELTGADQAHLRASLAHADVLIWVATTLGIDASVFDTPQVVANFDGYQQKDYYDSVRRYQDEDHMAKMLALSGVRMACSPEDLVEAIRAYLSNPLLDHEGREVIRKTQVCFMDGKSGKRLESALTAFCGASNG